MLRRLIPLPAALALAVAIAPAGAIAANDPDAKIAPWLTGRLKTASEEGFIVLFDDEAGLSRALAEVRGAPDRGRATYEVLAGRARRMQAGVRDELRAAGIPFRSLYSVNGLALRGDLALVRRLATHPEVVRIVGDPVVRGIEVDLTAPPPAPASTDSVEWGVSQINADDVWTLDGKRGEGIVVASADTGVEWNHPALINKYRGWNGTTASHDYNWFDAIQDTAVPLDDNNHGTHTTGTMVGDDGATHQIGVAPGAKWIACRNMDHGNGQPSTYIACNQFFLAPYPHGADPETAGDPSKRPDVINNSWTCPPSEGCDALVLESSFVALQEAGILAVAAAGNSGPGCGTVTDPPAIYGELFVAGATDSSNFLASFSSRGPVLADGSNRMRPDVAAPGVSVNSSIRGASYASFSGTSMASPHTAGAVALLWSAKPQVHRLLGITRCMMIQAARSVLQLGSPQTCGGTVAANRPNNFWGYGLVDAYGTIHLGPDADADGIPDACDCNPADGGAYDSAALVTGVVFAGDKQTLSWDSLAQQAGNGTVYDIVRGDLGSLHTVGSIATGSCLGTTGTSVQRVDPDLPAADAGFYYVVRAHNSCGGGGWGAGSNGLPRINNSCP